MTSPLNKFSILIDEVVKKNEFLLKKLHIYNPLTLAEANKFEKTLGVDIPQSYKEFVLKYGELFFLGDGFLGTIENPNRTLELKNDGHLLDGFIDIYELGDGKIYCIDTNTKDKNGESPIVAYLPGSDMTREDCYLISESFGDFILETVWNNLIEEGIDLSDYQHLKPKNKGWNYNEKV